VLPLQRLSPLLFSLLFSLLFCCCGDDNSRALRSLTQKGIPLRAEQVNAVVARGDEETLRELLACGVFARQTDENGMTPLEIACQRSDFRIVHMLLQHGVIDRNTAPSRGGPLVTAAQLADIAIAKTLLKHGAQPNATMPDGQPLLLWCLQHGRYVIADSLLDHGADIHVIDRHGNNALAYALQREQRALVEHLLELGADPGRATRDDQRLTPPVLRCWELGWHDLLPLLVKRGADLHARDAQGRSVIDLAIAQSREKDLLPLIEMGLDPNIRLADGRQLLLWSLTQDESFSLKLLEKGADPNTTDENRISVLLHAIHQSKRALCESLIQRKVDAKEFPVSPHPLPPVIQGAMLQGWHDLLEPLVKCGAGVDTVSQAGHTAADIALDQGNVPVFQQLLRLGSQPLEGTWSDALLNAVTHSQGQRLQTLLDAGIRPLTNTDHSNRLVREALRHGDTKVLEVLLQHDIHPPSLFHEACEAGRLDLLQLLEKNGIAPDPSCDASIDPPIHAAIRSGKAEVLHYLLERTHDVHVLGRENQTPLACAIARRQLDMVKLLLDHKADPNRPLQPKANAAFLAQIPSNSMRWYLVFDRNVTPLMLAANSGHVEMARTLMQRGAKLNAWTAVNKTWPLNFACRQADVPMMRLMLRKNPYVESQFVHVDLAKQEAKLFDVCGNVVFATKISSGKKGFATPKGTFVITNKHRTWNSTIYDNASMPCFQRLSCGDFGFHQGIVPGYPASHGCLRVPYGNAQKLFELTQVGDRVVIE